MSVSKLKNGSFRYRFQINHKQISFNSPVKLSKKDQVLRVYQIMSEIGMNTNEHNKVLLKATNALDSKNTTYVYFISNHRGAIKVGKAIDVGLRLKTLQTSSPYELEVIKAIPYCGRNYNQGEKFWQNAMKQHFKPLCGEWFEAEDNDVLKVISKYQNLDMEKRQT